MDPNTHVNILIQAMPVSKSYQIVSVHKSVNNPQIHWGIIRNQNAVVLKEKGVVPLTSDSN